MTSRNSPTHPRSRTCARCQRPPEQTGPLFCETCHPLVRREPLVQEVIRLVLDDEAMIADLTDGSRLFKAARKLAEWKP